MVENVDRTALAATISEIIAQQLLMLLRRQNSPEEFTNVADQVIASEHIHICIAKGWKPWVRDRWMITRTEELG